MSNRKDITFYIDNEKIPQAVSKLDLVLGNKQIQRSTKNVSFVIDSTLVTEDNVDKKVKILTHNCQLYPDIGSTRCNGAKDVLLNLILSQQFNVVCLQEVFNIRDHEFLSAQLKNYGYNVLPIFGNGKTFTKQSPVNPNQYLKFTHSGLFFATTFSILEYQFQPFTSRPNTNDSISTKGILSVKLDDLVSKIPLLVVTTHTEADSDEKEFPSSINMKDVKFSNEQQIFSVLQSQIKRSEDPLRIVVCGDFNTIGEDSKGYPTAEYLRLTQIMNGFGLRDVYKVDEDPFINHPIAKTFLGTQSTSRIDYFWCNKLLQTLTCQTVIRKCPGSDLPTHSNCSQKGQTVSDHIGLEATFHFKHTTTPSAQMQQQQPEESTTNDTIDKNVKLYSDVGSAKPLTIPPQVLYRVVIKTSEKYFAGTDSNVTLQIQGTTGITDRMPLESVFGGDEFERGETNEFNLRANLVGDIQHFLLHSDNTGSNPEWTVKSLGFAVNPKDSNLNYCVEQNVQIGGNNPTSAIFSTTSYKKVCKSMVLALDSKWASKSEEIQPHLRKTWRNYLDSAYPGVESQPLLTFYPTSIEDVQQLITFIREVEFQSTDPDFKLRMSIVGAGHSSARLVANADVLIRCDRLTKINKPTDSSIPGNQYVSFQAGVTILELIKFLKKQSKPAAFPNLGGAWYQTVIGAVSTGTHGSGIHLPPLCDMVRAVRLVTWTNEKKCKVIVLAPKSMNTSSWPVSYSPKEQVTFDDDLFYSSIVAFGTCGFAFDMLVEVVPMYKIFENRFADNINRINADYVKTLTKDNNRVEFLFNPYDDHTQDGSALTTVRTNEKVDAKSFGHRNLLRKLQSKVAAEALVFLLNLSPSHIPAALKSGLGLEVDNMLQDYDEVLTLGIPGNVPGASCEICVPFKHFNDSLQDILKLLSANQKFNRYLTLPFSARFVKASKHILSPAYSPVADDIFVYYELLFLQGTFGGVETLQQLERMLVKKYEGRPHWGQMNNLTSKHVENMYTSGDRLKTFKASRKLLDPLHVFSNAKIDTMGFNDD